MTDKSLSRPLACIILAAGKGTRMKSRLPKVLHHIAGEPMLGHVIRAVTPLAPERIIVVVAPGMEQVAAFAAPHHTVIQAEALGTANAVQAAAEALKGFVGDILVVFGDEPLVETAHLRSLVAARGEASDPAVVMMGRRPKDPGPYGRLIIGPSGLERIVEALDATPEEKKIDLIWTGNLVADGRVFFDFLSRIDNKNAKGEFYLTAIVAKAREAGRACGVFDIGASETVGVNSRSDLAAAEAIVQGRLRKAAMTNGATLLDPATVYFSLDTKLGQDVIVGPNVVFGPNVVVADDVEIRAFCHIEGATIASGALIGPFARIRPGTVVEEDVHIGNFVEIKNAVLGQGVKAAHLTYLGDATIGAGTNVGAGTVTVNYDGYAKHRTTIGAGAFIGSNSTLVAPLNVGAGGFVTAGSTITRDVEADAMAFGRAQQVDKPGKASRFRQLKKESK